MPKPPIEIPQLIPHRGRMLLISEIVSFDHQSATTRSTAAPHWPMVGPRGVNALVLVELVAQTAAVNNGLELIAREGPDSDVRGWIVGIKQAVFHLDHFPVGTTVTVMSKNRFAYDSFREVHGVAEIDNLVAAEVTLQLMQAES